MLKNKWVYKITQEDGNPKPSYKARLLVRGFLQRHGVDFDEIFSSTVKMTSSRVILGLAATLNLEVEHLDVKATFLYGNLEEDVYMEQPEGFKVKVKVEDDKVRKLVKSLYRFEAAPKQWYMRFESFMTKYGYKKIFYDDCTFVQRFGANHVLLLYMDDMLIIGQDTRGISKLKNEFAKAFVIKHLGYARHILGIQIVRDQKLGKLGLSQEQ